MAPNAPEKNAPDNYLTHTRGVASWLCTLDHKRIGVMYLVSILLMFLLGGVFALLIRTELLSPNKGIMGANMYNQMFTLHGAIMIFLFLIPGIPDGLGKFRAADHAGGQGCGLSADESGQLLSLVGRRIFFLIVLATGGLDTGWTFYTPYSTTTGTSVIPAVTGRLHSRLQFDFHGHQLHRHDAHACGRRA